MPRTPIEAKDHAFREKDSANLLQVSLTCPYHEAIIDEVRIESALRAALGVPDLVVTSIKFEVERFLH